MLQASRDVFIGKYVEMTVARPFQDGQQSPPSLTVERVFKRCVRERLEAVLERKVQVNRKKRLLDSAGEATLTMLACLTPSDYARWNLKLICECD